MAKMASTNQGFTLDNEFQIEQLMTDFKFCFVAKLNAAIESGAISEQDLELSPMIVARCVLVLAGESMTPKTPYGKAMLENLRKFV